MNLHIFVSIALIFLADLSVTERVLGVYIFQQHGDRTPRSRRPITLTSQGEIDEYTTGRFFYGRYLSTVSEYHIDGIGPDVITQDHISAEAPQEDMIISSGQAFLRGLFPATDYTTDDLQNLSSTDSIIDATHPIQMSTFQVSDSLDSFWDPSVDSCINAQKSIRSYPNSNVHYELLLLTFDFYQSLAPLVEGYLNSSELSYANAYPIWDLFNSELIRNPEINFAAYNLSSHEVMEKLSRMAYIYQFSLVHNDYDYVRAMGGYMLAGKVYRKLKKMIKSEDEPRLHVEFGTPETFLSYFGVNALNNHLNITIPRYSSSMLWELVTNDSGPGIPSESDIYVRFLYHDGPSMTNSTGLLAYPLFEQSLLMIPWREFRSRTSTYGIEHLSTWCRYCGNTEGQCEHKPDEEEDKCEAGLSFIEIIGYMAVGVVSAGLFILLIRVVCLCVPVFKYFVKVSKLSVAMAGTAITSSVDGLKNLTVWIGIWILVLPKGIFNVSKVLFGYILKLRPAKMTTAHDLDKDSEVSSVEMTGKSSVSPV